MLLVYHALSGLELMSEKTLLFEDETNATHFNSHKSLHQKGTGETPHRCVFKLFSDTSHPEYQSEEFSGAIYFYICSLDKTRRVIQG